MKISKRIAGSAVLAGALGGAAVAIGAGSAMADRGPDIPFIPGPPGHVGQIDGIPPGHLRHDFDGRHGHDDDVNVVVPVPQVPDVNVVVPPPPSVNVWLP
jgi:hypothetical protein